MGLKPVAAKRREGFLKSRGKRPNTKLGNRQKGTEGGLPSCPNSGGGDRGRGVRAA